MSINSRIYQLRTHLGLSQSEMAEALGVTRPYITNLESGRSSPSFNVLDLLMKKFEASADWLMRGKGEMVLTNRVHPSVHLSVHPNASSDELGVQNSSLSIPVIPVAAAAGIGFGNSRAVMPYEIEDWISYPGAKPGRYAFRVAGESMVPTLLDGDFAVCHRIETKDTPKNGLVLVATPNDVWIKRANPFANVLLLSSDNPNYELVAVPLSDKPVVYEVEKIVRLQDPGVTAPSTATAALQTQLNAFQSDVQKELNALRAEIQRLQSNSIPPPDGSR